jgi:hypothetical protein
MRLLVRLRQHLLIESTVKFWSLVIFQRDLEASSSPITTRIVKLFMPDIIGEKTAFSA